MAADTFRAILDNVGMARQGVTPICQDTGSLIFYVYHPVGLDTLAFRRAIDAATEKATKDILLRPNAVESHHREEHRHQPRLERPVP